VTLPNDTHAYKTNVPNYMSPHTVVCDTCITPECTGPLFPRHTEYGTHSTHVNLSAPILYTAFDAYNITILPALCDVCGQPLVYDGCEDRVFRFTERRLFSHHLFNSFLADTTCSTTPFHAFCTKVKRQYEGNTSVHFVTQTLFMDALFAFIHLQDWKFEFACPLCGCEPEDVIFDGTFLTIPRDYAQNIRPPTYTNAASPVRERLALTPMMYILDDDAAKFVKRYCGQLYRRDNAANFQPLLEEEKLVMWHKLYNYTGTAPLCVSMQHNDSIITETTAFALCYKRLYRVLASQEPVMQLLPLRAAVLINSILTCQVNWTTEQQDQLQQSAPLVYDIMVNHLQLLDSNYVHHIPLHAQALLTSVANRTVIVMNHLRGGDVPSNLDTFADEPFRHDRYINQYRSTGCYYGAHTKRARPVYPHVKETGQAAVPNARSADTTPCNKLFSTFRKLTGGVMLGWCRHRICIGFHVIKDGEGRNDVFSAIYSRWTKAPRTVIYDFACQLHTYNVVREPTFFADTVHLIDQCHEANHTACSEAHMLSVYKKTGNRRFHLINDSAAEVGNQGVDKLKPSARYMTLGRFMDTTKVHLEIQNRIRIRKLARHEQQGI
jgi:hypothetical protein